MAEAEQRLLDDDDPCYEVRKSFIFLKHNLIIDGLLIDELYACYALSDDDKVDLKHCKENLIKRGRLIKSVLRNGESACREFLSIIEKKTQYGIFKSIRERCLQLQELLPLTYEVRPSHLITHRTVFLEEIEPSCITDYLFQESVLSIDDHDEIEEKNSRTEKVQLILHKIGKKENEPDAFRLFSYALKNAKSDNVFEILQNKPVSDSIRDECVDCVRLNFRFIRSELHYDITVEHLIQEGLISCDFKAAESPQERGKLVKVALNKGPTGCICLLAFLQNSNKDIFEHAKFTWRERMKKGRRHLSQQLTKSDLIRHEKLLSEELEPCETNDILLEENAFKVTDHTDVESLVGRRRKAEVILTRIRDATQDILDSFVYALEETEKKYILEQLKSDQSDVDQTQVASRYLHLVSDGGFPLVVPEGAVGNVNLILKVDDIHEEDSPSLRKVVTVINRDPDVKIEVVQETHMGVDSADYGSVIIHLRPLTDDAVRRLLDKDGQVLTQMLEKIFSMVGVQKLMKGHKVKVKLSEKKRPGDQQEYEDRTKYSFIRRGIKDNWRTLVKELEPYQLVHHLVLKRLFEEKEKDNLDKKVGRTKRAEYVLQKIVDSPSNEIIHSFLEYLENTNMKQLLHTFTCENREDSHKVAENMRTYILENFKDLVDEIETSIIEDTLSKCPDVPPKTKEDFSPKSGKSRKMRAHDFLVFILKDDENLLELTKVLKDNKLKQFVSIEERPGEIKPVTKTEATSLKEGELFECNYTITVSEDDEKDKSDRLLKIISPIDARPDLTLRSKYEKVSLPPRTIRKEFPATEQAKPFTKGEKRIVVAIDFGTTYSGFAFSDKDNPSSIITKKWDTHSGESLESLKTPTTLLLDSNNKLLAFGYEAENLYKEFVEDERQRQCRFFKSFKMTLHNIESLDSKFMIRDQLGNPMVATEIFSISIKYLKDKFREIVNDRELMVDDSSIQWVLTVPAIWDEFAKQFMRNAAEQVGIPSEQLTLALEPEVAAIYVITEAKTELTTESFTTLNPGKRIMVIDLGGGTVDFNVVEITTDQKLKHLHHATGGDWGGNAINRQIWKIFCEIFGSKVIDTFRENKADELEMENNIELKKRDLKTENKLTLTIFPNLAEICKEKTGKTYKEILEKSVYSSYLQVRRGKVVFKQEMIKVIFESTLSEIDSHIKTILETPSTTGVQDIILVGGFSESEYLQHHFKTHFKSYNILIPIDPGLAVLKGAVKFGHDQSVIKSRVCSYTYGIEGSRYYLATDPEEKLITVEGKKYCKEVFEKLVTIGDSMDVGATVEKEVFALTSDMTKMKLNLYRTKKESPLFITDSGCELFGQLEIDMPDITGGVNRSVIVSMKFGETEIMFSGKDKKSERQHQILLAIYG